MLDFMDYIQLAFAEACGWKRNNSYSSLNDTAKAILDFPIPQHLKLNVSSLSTPQFATAYTLGTLGLIDGSISYLYTSVPLDGTPSRSTTLPLRGLVPGYKQVYPPDFGVLHDVNDTISDGNDPVTSDTSPLEKPSPTLLYASLHLPSPTTLTALFLRHLSPQTFLSVSLCSTRATPLYKNAPQASLLTRVVHDTGKYCVEGLFGTDSALFGVRGLWNFEALPRDIEGEEAGSKSERYTADREKEREEWCWNNIESSSGGGPGNSSSGTKSFISAGAEAYYSPISSVIGMSTGLRFTTLPSPSSQSSSSSSSQQSSSSPIPIPYTLTLTLTPLTGSLSTAYSILASENIAFSSRFGFNVYSWESEMVAGCEIWRRRKATKNDDDKPRDNLDWARKKKGIPLLYPEEDGRERAEEERQISYDTSSQNDSVVKLRVDQSYNVRLLWEGKFKELIVSAGVGLGPQGDGRELLSGGGQSSHGVGYGWTGVGMSILYSS
ncbi:Mitochondrial distribution and morphology protein 10 [Ascosphaera atra]|nr:Mitochondrial distribution and morphology protein 10 [Ascosphaera atra]